MQFLFSFIPKKYSNTIVQQQVSTVDKVFTCKRLLSVLISLCVRPCQPRTCFTWRKVTQDKTWHSWSCHSSAVCCPKTSVFKLYLLDSLKKGQMNFLVLKDIWISLGLRHLNMEIIKKFSATTVTILFKASSHLQFWRGRGQLWDLLSSSPKFSMRSSKFEKSNLYSGAKYIFLERTFSSQLRALHYRWSLILSCVETNKYIATKHTIVNSQKSL